MTPIVSVCIANYNGIDIIDECIESVRQQEFELPVEIIVHDDASTDGSAEHIRTRYPDVRLIESQENVGFCVANNRMAAEAHGDYLLLLNNDAAILPDAIRTLHDESIRLVQPAILTLPQFDYDSGELIDRGCLLDPFFNPVPNLDINRQDVAMVIGACLWIPNQLWKELEGFPEWFGSIGEDLYLCCRARIAGHAVRAAQTSGYRHRVGQSFGGGKVQRGRLVSTYYRRALSEQNKTFTMIACQPIQLLIIVLPVHLSLLLVEGLALAIVRLDIRIWRAIYAPLMSQLWKHRNRLKRARNVIQDTRKVEFTDWLATFKWMPRKIDMLLRFGFPTVR